MSIRTDGLREIYGLPKDSDLTVAQEMELYHPDDRPRLREALSRALEERVSYDLELRLITESGEERWVRVRGEPQVSGGAVVRVRGTVQDITEQKRREEALREAKKEAEKASRLKSAMLANMNHEIRTPLTSVKGFADLMRKELGGQMGKFAEQIHTSSERLMRTLDSVLRLSKLESEISDIERTDVDLTRMTRETAELLRPSAKKKQVALETNLPAGEVRGKCNEGAVDRIMENLIENAIKFTPEGGAVTVRLREEQEEAVLEIEDTGVGIAKPAQAEIFDAFQQESEGLGREFEGSGLGLSIVKRLVEAQGGTIEVESEKGEGSRFTARLPKPEPKGLRDG